MSKPKPTQKASVGIKTSVRKKKAIYPKLTPLPSQTKKLSRKQKE